MFKELNMNYVDDTNPGDLMDVAISKKLELKADVLKNTKKIAKSKIIFLLRNRFIYRCVF